MAQRAVSRVNLDLMFALPGQTLAACTDDLRQALAFGTEHLSLYHLTMEPNTVFAKFPPEDLPDDDTSAAMQDLVETELATAGLARYEVSAYARSGARCRHNLNYWEFGDYLGIGPGAHGKLSFHDRIVREARLRNPESWMQAAAARDGSHLAESRQVGPDELPFEFMLNALRLKDGVAATLFSERTGLSLAVIAHHWRQRPNAACWTPIPPACRRPPGLALPERSAGNVPVAKHQMGRSCPIFCTILVLHFPSYSPLSLGFPEANLARLLLSCQSSGSALDPFI